MAVTRQHTCALDLDVIVEPGDDHHEHVCNRHRARVVVVAFDRRSLLLRTFDRLLEDLIHERARLRATLLDRKAKDGFGDGPGRRRQPSA